MPRINAQKLTSYFVKNILFTKQGFLNTILKQEMFLKQRKNMRVTIDDIAKLAGVSKATVSRVINNSPNGVGEETRKRVLQVVKDTNYERDSYFGSGKARTIALVQPDITNPFFADIAKAIERTAAENGYMVIISNTDFSAEKEAENISKLITQKICGVILISSSKEVLPEHMIPGKYGIPIVLLDRKLVNNDCFPGVYSDTAYAAFRSCELMIKKGADRIAFISGHSKAFTSADRMNGFMDAYKQYGLDFEPSLIKEGNYMVESGYNAVMELVREGTRFTAILAANDLMALGALKALKELSIAVPNDVQLIGFDNIIYTQLCDPPLSTVQQPTIEMGKKAVNTLLNLIDGKKVDFNITLQPRLVLRDTTR